MFPNIFGALVIWLAMGLGASAQPTETFSNFINGLPSASSLGAADQLYIRQGGVSKQIPGASINGGVTFSGTPSAGYVPIAMGATTAAWGNIWTTTIGARPASVAVWPTTAFTGTNTGMNFGINYTISGAGTLGTPSGGIVSAPVYITTPEASPFVSLMTNSSGANPDLGDNYNRTAAIQMALFGVHNGQGDFLQTYCNLQLNNHLVGATTWLANPAVTCISGNLAASSGGAGGFSNPINFVVADNGFDIAAVMQSTAGNRANNTAALNQVWLGTYWQSTGPKAWDAFYSAVGPVKVGVDLTAITTQASGLVHAGMIMKAGDCVYFNGTAGTPPSLVAATTGGDSICYSSGSSGLIFSTGGSAAFEVIAGQNVSVNFLNAIGGMAVSGTGVQIGSPTGGDKGAGTINIQSTIWTNGTQGVVSKTCTVNQALTLVFTNGILTGGSCNA